MTQQYVHSVLCATLCGISLVMTPVAKADPLHEQNKLMFMVTPKQCTTLEQGQDCYVNLEVKWQSQSNQSYCLWLDQTQLQCWQEVRQGHWQQELIINKDADVILRAASDKLPQGNAKIKYAWVYQKRINKANLWRMF